VQFQGNIRGGASTLCPGVVEAIIADMNSPIFHVDAFAEQPFQGNPAAVCLLEGAGEDVWMQHVAMEMNLSETAFVHPVEDGWSLRWFTPAVEVDLCGHATLASAHVLWETGKLKQDQSARFQTRSGVLTCARSKADGSRSVAFEIEMDFPSKPAAVASAPDGLLEALGLTDATVARSMFDFLVQVESEQIVRAITPDFARLKRVDARGIIVTARSSGQFDFVSRFFAPQSGVDEDPVTGSAHCTLAPWWGTRLGKDRMSGFQASKRGGVVGVRIQGDRVILSGRAITTVRGELVC
jgi:PhzF family phenazine biosynthesis protein